MNSPLKSVILRLGGFNLEMSFVGGIGHLMEGSGITELLETVYAPNAVTHMTSGKAIARAVRAHFLIDTALTSIILSHHTYTANHFQMKSKMRLVPMILIQQST